MAHQIQSETVSGRVIHHLRDKATGASASIVPSFGFNLFDLQLPVGQDGRLWPILDAEPNWWEHPEHASRHGTPILFPFPNRIRDARFEFEGQTFELVPNKPPHAIHGFALEADWEVIDLDADEQSAWIAGRYQISRQSPEDRQRWPSDAVLEVRYTLSGPRLTLDARVENPDTRDLPWGFGIHPYFRLPFDPSGDRDRTRIIFPANEYWVLDQAIPTGERRPVDDRLDFREGQPITNLKLDDVLTGLEFQGDHAVCRLIDENLGAEFRIQVNRMVRELVIFTPPWSDGGVIAVEPYTQTTDAINLQRRGLDAGLRVLRPGESEAWSIQFAMVGEP